MKAFIFYEILCSRKIDELTYNGAKNSEKYAGCHTMKFCL